MAQQHERAHRADTGQDGQGQHDRQRPGAPGPGWPRRARGVARVGRQAGEHIGVASAPRLGKDQVRVQVHRLGAGHPACFAGLGRPAGGPGRFHRPGAGTAGAVAGGGPGQRLLSDAGLLGGGAMAAGAVIAAAVSAGRVSPGPTGVVPTRARLVGRDEVRKGPAGVVQDRRGRLPDRRRPTRRRRVGLAARLAELSARAAAMPLPAGRPDIVPAGIAELRSWGNGMPMQTTRHR